MFVEACGLWAAVGVQSRCWSVAEMAAALWVVRRLPWPPFIGFLNLTAGRVVRVIAFNSLMRVLVLWNDTEWQKKPGTVVPQVLRCALWDTAVGNCPDFTLERTS